MEKDPIKSAFSKVKEDIINLQSQIQTLTQEIHELKRTLTHTDRPTDTSTVRQITPTHSKYNQTQQENPLIKQQEEAPNQQNITISTGNEGVQTDRQTIRQTDRQQQKFALDNISLINKDKISNIEKVSEVLNSLDSIKKDLRAQFKKVTTQELLIFSTIYRLEEQGLTVDYSLLAEKTSLTQSSIRDYVQNLIKKGIPIIKSKENNKKITLSIPHNLKKIASLETILQLRDL
jgi:transcriptional regulator